MSNVCPRCGAAASGKFCSNCGSALVGAPAAPGSGRRLPWIVAGIALVAVIALVLVQTVSTSPDPAAGGAPPTGLGPGGMPSAADIANMSPEEKSDRLFNRVMMYASEGKRDSAAIFAPMAIQSYDMIGVHDAHQHFDIGLVAVVSGDLVRAKVEADSILMKNPDDLLGLTLAIRVAEASGNSAARADYDKRLIAAEPAERRTTRQDYVDHGNDIDAALKDARGRKP